MHAFFNKKRRRLGLLLAAALGVPLITGCEFGSVFAREDPGPADFQDASEDDGAIERERLTELLDVMRSLVEGDLLTQTETFLNVAEAAAATQTTGDRVTYALAVAIPGHPNSDPAAAQTLLSRLLAEGVALLPEERMLVAIHLKEVEERLILDAEARRLRDEAEAAREAQDDERARRLAAVLAENERLTRELQEAQSKLDAITNIERSIRERENGANP